MAYKSRFPILTEDVEKIPKKKMSLFITKLMEHLYGGQTNFMATRTMTSKAASVGAGQKAPLDMNELEEIIGMRLFRNFFFF